MGVIYPTIMKIIAPTIGNPFGLPVGGGVLSQPPYSEDLLVWLRGNDDGVDQKLDSWKKPDAENFDMSKSSCIFVNGTDEKISMPDMPSDATITYQGTATAVVDTVLKEITFTTAGTFYDLNVWTDL